MTREKDLKKDLAKLQAERDDANAEIARLRKLVTPIKKENYTKEEMDTIKGVDKPLTLDKAKELGQKLNRSHRSIISKAKDLGVPYKAQPRKPQGEPLVSKTKLINQILDAMSDKLVELAKTHYIKNSHRDFLGDWGVPNIRDSKNAEPYISKEKLETMDKYIAIARKELGLKQVKRDYFSRKELLELHKILVK